MTYRRIVPGQEAARFVSHYWTLEGDPAGMVQRVVPDGCPELIINLGVPFEMSVDGAWREQPRCFIAGQLTGPLLLRAAGPSQIIGVTFQPQGLAEIVGSDMQQLTGRNISLDTLGLEQLADLPPRSPIAVLEERLLRQAKPGDQVAQDAVRRIVGAHGCLDIASLARDFGLSTRNLERRFLYRVGLPPKLYARMRRFQRVFSVVEQGGNWAAAAVFCGYYDQAHLIRDFRQFAGEPPARLLAAADLARHFLSHFSKTTTLAIR